MEWLNEPPRWHERDGALCVVTGGKTDFWRTTHYGFVREAATCASRACAATLPPR